MGRSRIAAFLDGLLNSSGQVIASGLAPGAARTNFGAGAVLQVVNATYSTSVTNATGTFVDTGLSATITPSSATSKILVTVNQSGCGKAGGGNTFIQLRLLRNSSVILNVEDGASYTGDTNTNWVGAISTSYLDSPTTTSSITYKTQFASGTSSAYVLVQSDQPNSNSSITLMEIAA